MIASGYTYRHLIHSWCQVLPAQSICLSVPLVPPSQYNQAWARQHQDLMRERRQWERNPRLTLEIKLAA